MKQRDYPTLGFGSFASAARFCAAFDELRQDFRWRHFRWRRGRVHYIPLAEHIPLAEQRRLFASRRRALLSETAAAGRQQSQPSPGLTPGVA